MRLAIVGGGISGLSLAYFLIEQNFDGEIHLFEKEASFGGKIETTYLNTSLVEHGADSILMQGINVENLLKDLIGTEGFIDLNTEGFHILSNGKKNFIPSGVASILPRNLDHLLSLDLFTESEKKRILEEREIEVLESDESIKEFVSRRFGSAMFDKLIGPVYSGLLGTDTAEISIDAAFPQIKALEKKHGSLIRAAEKIKKQSFKVISLDKGLGIIIEKLIEKIGSTVQFHHEEVVSANKKELWNIKHKNGKECGFDHVVFTTTANQTAKILKSNSPDLSDALASISHKSMASVYYIIPDQLISISKKSSGVIIAKSDQNNITACTISSLKFKRDETQSGDLIRAFIRSEKTLKLDKDSLREKAWEDIKSVLEIDVVPVGFSVRYWRDAMPVYGMNHLRNLSKIDILKSDNSLHFIGASYKGVGISRCIENAHALSQAIL